MNPILQKIEAAGHVVRFERRPLDVVAYVGTGPDAIEVSGRTSDDAIEGLARALGIDIGDPNDPPREFRAVGETDLRT